MKYNQNNVFNPLCISPSYHSPLSPLLSSSFLILPLSLTPLSLSLSQSVVALSHKLVAKYYSQCSIHDVEKMEAQLLQTPEMAWARSQYTIQDYIMKVTIYECSFVSLTTSTWPWIQTCTAAFVMHVMTAWRWIIYISLFMSLQSHYNTNNPLNNSFYSHLFCVVSHSWVSICVHANICKHFLMI